MTNQETTFSGTHFDTLFLDGTSAGNAINGTIFDSTGTTGSNYNTRVTKQNASTWTLNGSNVYTGATTVTCGTLVLGSSGNLYGTATVGSAVAVGPGVLSIAQNGNGTANAIGQSGQTTPASLTLAAGGSLNMGDGYASTLNVYGAATLAPASGTSPVLIFDIIGGSSDLLSVTGIANAGAAGARIAIAPSAAPLTPGSYTVITSTNGSSALNTNFSLASTLLPNSSGLYSLSLSASSATSTVVTVSADANALYWSGAASADWIDSNWNTDVSSNTAGGPPGATSDVVFSTTTPAPGNLTNAPSAPLTVNSVSFLPGSPAVTINGTNALTVNGGGLFAASATAQTISAPLTLGASQLWTNSGTGLLTIGGAITLGANNLTVAGTGNVAIGGALGGAGGLTVNGPGVLTLSAANTYTGATAINSTVQLANPSALATSAVTVNAGTVLQLRSDTAATFATSGPITSTLNNAAMNIDVNNANSSVTGNTLTLSSITFNQNNVAKTINVTGGNGYSLAITTMTDAAGSSNVNPSITINAVSAPVTIGVYQTSSYSTNQVLQGGNSIKINTLNLNSNTPNSITITGAGTVVTLGNIGSSGSRTGGTNAYTLNPGATLNVTNAASIADTGSATAASLTINGGTLDNTFTGALTESGNPTQTWAGDFTFTGTQSLNLGTGAVALSASCQVNVLANTLTVGGAISGTSLGLTKTGAGTLALGGASTYTGATAINAGTLLLNGSGSLSTASAVAVNSGATLAFGRSDSWGNAGGSTASSPITINAGGTVSSGGFFNTIWGLTLNGGTLISNGGVNANYGSYDLAGTVTATAGVTSTISAGSGSFNTINLGNGTAASGTTFNVGAGGTLNVGTVLQDHSYTSGSTFQVAGSLSKTGTGTMVLTAANTFTGGAALYAGVLNLQNATALGGTAGVFTVYGGSFDTTAAGLTLTANNPQAWNGDVNFIGTGSLNLGSGGVTLNANRVVTVGANTLTVGGVINTTFGMTKSGAGTLALANTSGNTLGGGVTLNAGTLSIWEGNSLGVAGSPATCLTFTGSSTLTFGHQPGTIVASRTFQINSGVVATIDPAAYSVEIDSTLAGSGSLKKVSGGALLLKGVNTFTGGTEINAGTLGIWEGSALGPSTQPTVNTFSGNSTLQFEQTPTALPINANRSFVINNGVTATVDVQGFNVSFDSVFSGQGGLTKTGSGRMTLNAGNTYSGATTVNNGELSVMGQIVSAATVASGGALRGTGTVANVSTGSGGVVWPGTTSNTASPLAANEVLTVPSGSTVNLSGGKLKSILTMNGAAATGQVLIVLNTADNSLVIDSNTVLSLAVNSANFGTTPIPIITSPSGTNLLSTAFNTANILGLPSGWTVQYQHNNGGLFPNPGFPNPPFADTVFIVPTNASVTPVKLDAFTASSTGNGVALTWHTVSEFQNAGYNLYRRNVGETSWNKVNPTLIAGRVTHADDCTYRAFDWAVPGRYEYRLESVSIANERESYKCLAGPIEVDALGLALDTLSDDTMLAVATSIAADQNTARVAEVNTLFAAGEEELGGPAHRAGSRQRQEALPTTSATVRALNLDNAADVATLSSLAPNPSPLAPAVIDASVAARWFSPARPSGSSSYSAVKVVYSQSGVLAIPQSSLPNGFDINHVSITREGKTMPALAIKNNVLYVFAPGYSDDYTDKDALFLRTISGTTNVSSASTATGLFASAQPVNTTAATTVTQTFHDVYFDYSTTLRPYTFTPWFSSQYLTDGSDQTFTVNTPSASSGSATLTVNLWSVTTSGHTLQVLVNGQAVGQSQWTGGNQMMQLAFTIPSNVLANANTIELVSPSTANTTGQVSFLHSLQINYTKALDGAVPLTINNVTNGALYEIANVPNGAWVIDTRYPDRPSMVATETSGSKIRFQVAIGGTGVYQMIPLGFENAPLSVSPRKVQPLRTSTMYLATGPAQFASGVQPLIAQHTKEGLRSLFVDQEQLFDYYSYGRYSPYAIQSAVRSVQPRYLMLVGRTTYDYHNYSGANVDPLCPSFLVSTSFWAQTVSDSMFGDLGRGYAQVAIGRLPVNDTTELAGAVRHILTYKGFPSYSGIVAQATSDIADPEAGDFAAQSDAVVTAHPEYTWQKNYLGVTAPAITDATAALTTAANGGADLLMYMGHGNAAALGSQTGASAEKILDLTSIQNWTGNTILLQGTCTAHWFAKDVQNYHSLAIQALTQAQGGIAASIGTSTYMNSDVTANFMNQLLKNVGTRGQRWGAALLLTQQWAYAQKGSTYNADMAKTESLFGDPAMQVYAPNATNGGGGGGGTRGVTNRGEKF